jgi:arylsulfatase A-like enzyme
MAVPSLPRARRVVAFALALGIAAAFLVQVRRSPRRTPDILLISIDTLRAGHLGCYGYTKARTPNIDALADEGTLFLNAYTPFPRTTPAIASLFTGRWPSEHRSREVKERMVELPTLAGLLKKRGYHTVAVVSTDALSESTNVHIGFERSLVRNIKHARNVNRKVRESLAQVPSEKPLFLWVHYMDPHWGYEPLDEWRSAGCTPECYSMSSKAGEFVSANMDGKAERVLESCIACYDDEIAHVDHSAGELLRFLRERRTDRERLVVVTSDHGENMGEGGVYYEHGPTVHEVALRVPLVVAGPGVRSGVEKRLVSLVDVLPTLLGHLEVPRDEWPTTSGRDLSAWLSAPDASSGKGDGPAVFAESGSALFAEQTGFVRSGTREGRHCLNAERYSLCEEPGEDAVLYDHVEDPWLRQDSSEAFPEKKARLLEYREKWPPEEARERTVISRRFKLVERPRVSGGYRSSLYDLTANPAEQEDVSSVFPDETQRLQESLDSWTALIAQAPQSELRSAATLEQLRSLGYVR